MISEETRKKLSKSISKAKIKRAIRLYGTILDHPILKKQFDITNTYKAGEVPLSATEIIIKWICHKCGKKWKSSPGSRCSSFIWPKSPNKKERNVSECPNCFVKIASKLRVASVLKKQGSILENYPEIHKIWDYKKNTVDPNELTLATNYVAWFVCKRHGSYDKRPQQIIRDKQGCPKCNTNRFSKAELRVYSEIKYIFKSAIWNYWEDYYQLDIFLKEYNIGLEIDGPYHIKSHKRDVKKNKYFKKHGIELIRLRDVRIKKKISNYDFFVDTNKIKLEDIKKVLHRLSKLRKLNQKIKSLIDNYNKQKKFQNLELYNKELGLRPFAPSRINLKLNYPKLSEEWHYEKNNPERPEFFSYGSNQKVWWRCLKKRNDFPEVLKLYKKTYNKYVLKKHPDYKSLIKSRTKRNVGCFQCGVIKSRLNHITRSIKKKGSLKSYPKIIENLKSNKERKFIKKIADQIPIGQTHILFNFYCKKHKHTWRSDFYRESHKKREFCRYCEYETRLGTPG